jgi:hypothetical protein
LIIYFATKSLFIANNVNFICSHPTYFITVDPHPGTLETEKGKVLFALSNTNSQSFCEFEASGVMISCLEPLWPAAGGRFSFQYYWVNSHRTSLSFKLHFEKQVHPRPFAAEAAGFL